MRTNSKISINVALCGSVPRSSFVTVHEPSLANSSIRADPTHSVSIPAVKMAAAVASRSKAAIEIPTWAVPASCDARLEPICDAAHHHPRLNLTQRASYVIGRSPTAQLQLLHKTCSRSHALLAHHINGSFLIKDLQSGHGTYVNGIAIPTNVWFKLKKGSLIRFGSGNDAPAFIFKSFCVGFDRMVLDLDHISNAFSSSSDCDDSTSSSCSSSSLVCDSNSDIATLSSKHKLDLDANHKMDVPVSSDHEIVSCIRGDGGMACILDRRDAPAAALTLLHTRMNACGQQLLSPRESNVVRQAIQHFTVQCCENDQVMSMRPTKKRRTRSTELRVSFSMDTPKIFYPPAVTPDEYFSDDDHTND